MGGLVSRSRSDSNNGKTERHSTAAAFKAVDTRNAKKLKKVLSMGVNVGGLRPPRPVSSVQGGPPRPASNVPNGRRPPYQFVAPPTSPRPVSLLEYAVEKNFILGVEVMLEVIVVTLHC
jgi:hypothetical protein